MGGGGAVIHHRRAVAGNGGTVLKDTASLPPEYFHCEVGSQVVPGGVASVTKFDDFT